MVPQTAGVKAIFSTWIPKRVEYIPIVVYSLSMEKIERDRWLAIKKVIFDVDGVLTDGRIIMDGEGRELKFFNVKDGHGIVLLHRAGLSSMIITGRRSKVVEQRAKELGITEVYQKIHNKLGLFQELVEKNQLTPKETAYVGDDIVDIPIMKRVGLAVTVADAHPDVKKVAHYIASLPGGKGAVREFIEMLLKIQGHWDKVTERYWL